MSKSVEEVTVEVTGEPMVHQVAKMLIGAIACFIVTKGVSFGYDAAVTHAHKPETPAV